MCHCHWRHTNVNFDSAKKGIDISGVANFEQPNARIYQPTVGLTSSAGPDQRTKVAVEATLFNEKSDGVWNSYESNKVETVNGVCPLPSEVY